MSRRLLPFALAGLAGAFALFMSSGAHAMTSIADQDTSDIPEGYGGAIDINLANTADTSLPGYVPWEADWPSFDWLPGQGIANTDVPTPGYVPFEDGWLPQEAVNPATQAPYQPWEEGWSGQEPSSVYVPFEQGWAIADPAYVPYEGDWIPQDTAPAYTPFEEGFPMNSAYVPDDIKTAAFLYMIRCCEHLYPTNILNNACYGIFYSGRSGFNPPELVGQRFVDFSDHPVITGACQAVPLPDAICAAAGLGEGCVSTAAGAYQIIRPTWLRHREARGDLPRLADFSAASQDEVGKRILQFDCGQALATLHAGRFPEAVTKAARAWASLPGATTKQNPKKQAYALARYTEGLTLYLGQPI